MLPRRFLGAWFALAALLAASYLWCSRYDYQACDLDGCIAVNRWTGRVHFEPAHTHGAEETEGGVLVSREVRVTNDPGAGLAPRTAERGRGEGGARR